MLKRIACALLAAGMLAGAAGAEPLLESWDKGRQIEGGEGRYHVWDGDLWGVARADGETIIEPMFQNDPGIVGRLTAASIRGGAFTGVSEAVEYSRLYGAVNRAGEIVIPLEYGDLALSDDGRIATVELDGRYGFIDAQGNEILPPTYDGAGPFVDGYAAVMRSEPLPPDADVSETGRRSYGAVDESGREVIACGYEYLEIHPGPLAIVQVGDLYGRDRHGGKLHHPAGIPVHLRRGAGHAHRADARQKKRERHGRQRNEHLLLRRVRRAGRDRHSL